MDVLESGDILGHCKLMETEFMDQLQHISPLQSWAPELRFFKTSTKRPIESFQCDVVIEKPTVILKIDAAMNMFHHFCDFFNL